VRHPLVLEPKLPQLHRCLALPPFVLTAALALAARQEARGPGNAVLTCKPHRGVVKGLLWLRFIGIVIFLGGLLLGAR